MKAWDDIPEDERPFQRRLMEVAAGFAEHVDVQVGRIVDELDRLGYGENTLFLYIWGDNGSSAEGQDGTIAELLAQNGIPTTPRMHIDALEQLGGLDVLGSPKTDNQYHSGWGWAGSTPYKGVKLVASHLGGTRNPLAIRWPKKVAPDPVPRDHFLHCNDVVPTIYDIVGIEPPLIVNGVPQIPIAGASFARTLTDPSAPGGKKTQYFEIMGSRAIYHDGWMASTFGPRVPWLPGLPPGIQDWTPDNDRWELYHLDEDWSQAHDLAAEMPEKLAQMRELFAIEAARNTGAPDRWWPVGADLPSRVANHAALSRVGVPRRNHPHPRVLRARAGKQEQHRHCRSRSAPRCERSPLCSRRLCRRGHLLPRRRVPVLRVQLFHHLPHQDSLDDQTSCRADDDRRGDPLCRTAPGGTARHHHPSRPGGPREGQCAGQRAAYCSPPTTASTSASASARRCHWTTTTRRPSPSTAKSSVSTWHTPDNDPHEVMLRPRTSQWRRTGRRHEPHGRR